MESHYNPKKPDWEDDPSFEEAGGKKPKPQGMFAQPFSLSGRIRRLEYGISLIICYIFLQLIFIIAPIVGDVVPTLIFIPLVWFGIAQGVKRCHDMGFSGFMQIIPFFGLVMLFMDGKRGTNRHGPNPKGKV